MRRKSAIAVTASIMALSFGFTACSGPAEESEPSGSAGGADSAEKTLSFWTNEPEILVPQANPGSQAAMAMCANLTETDADTGETELLVAESIETDDSQTYTIKLRDWTFHDGSPVTASSYVDAWNKTAYGPNGWRGNGFFTSFEGYEAMNPAEGEPTAETLSGLKVIDDKTIEITTTIPNVDVPKMLSSNPTCPLPELAFSDPEAYEEEPFNNGPYKFVEWVHNQTITLERWEDFPGDMQAFGGGAETLIGKIYTSQEPAYNAMRAGELDMMRNVPPTMVEQARTDLGEEGVLPIDAFRQQLALHFPAYVEELQDPALRKAISMSIDRESIATALAKGGVVPADSLMTPLFDAYREGACGDSCQFDPEAAKALLEEAGGFDGTLNIAYAAGTYDNIVNAVMNQVRQNLEIDVQLQAMQPPEFAAAESGKTFEGAAVRLWGMAYASPIQYLSQYQTNGSGNSVGRYSNPEVDELLAQAPATTDEAERIEIYQQAEDLILEDMPAAPLFYPVLHAIHSECALPRHAAGDLQYYRAEYTC